jgi:hypothetical protein
MASARRILASVFGATLLMLVITNLVSTRLLGQTYTLRDWFVSLATAVVVGGFLTLVLLGRRVPRKPDVEGFDVTRVEEHK